MRLVAILSLAALTACYPTEENAMTPEPEQMQSCGAPDMQRLVGQSEEVLHKMRLKPPVRIIRPDTAVTMDFREDRLNIELDATGQITRVFCG